MIGVRFCEMVRAGTAILACRGRSGMGQAAHQPYGRCYVNFLLCRGT